MAELEIGSRLGVAHVGNPSAGIEVTADGANTFTVAAADVPFFWAGQKIDIYNKSTNASLATNRQITNITSAGVITYDGADVALVAGTHVVVPAGEYSTTGRSNLNAGMSEGSPLNSRHLLNIDSMRARLKVINATLYTDAVLNNMTLTDMQYAIRLSDHAGSVR